jgi:UDPglucose 6-dehydrogenase
MTVNDKQKTRLIASIKNYFGGSVKGKTIAIWGLAFKPDTDDIREAPSLSNIQDLLKEGASVKVHDPEAMENVKKLFGDKIQYCENQYDAIKGADGLLIATEWSEYRTPDFDLMGSTLKNKVIFDGRNLYSLESMSELGFTYFSIGRNTVKN